jgi:hypothetical protein
MVGDDNDCAMLRAKLATERADHAETRTRLADAERERNEWKALAKWVDPIAELARLASLREATAEPKEPHPEPYCRGCEYGVCPRHGVPPEPHPEYAPPCESCCDSGRSFWGICTTCHGSGWRIESPAPSEPSDTSKDPP